MKRYESAMKHPLVTLITHPTNRIVPTRRGYDLDYDRLFEMAVSTGTIVEIDGSPSHLDLTARSRAARIRRRRGVHRQRSPPRRDARRQMDPASPRAAAGSNRGTSHTRSLADVRALIAAKRGR